MAQKDPVQLFVRWMLPNIGEPRSAVLVAIDYCDSTGEKVRGASETMGTYSIIFHNLLASVALQHHQGILVKFTGDGCLAVFVPEESGQRPAADRALSSVLDFRKRIDEFNAVVREKAQIYTKIGIHCGDVHPVNYDNLLREALKNSWAAPFFSGVIRETVETRWPNFDPHGLAVDLTFRIMSHAEKGQILVSEELLDILESTSNIVQGPVTPIPVKGMTNKVSVVEIAPEGKDLIGIGPPSPNWPIVRPKLAALKELHDLCRWWLDKADRVNRACYTILKMFKHKSSFVLALEGKVHEADSLRDFLSAGNDPNGQNHPEKIWTMVQHLTDAGCVPEKPEKDVTESLRRLWGTLLDQDALNLRPDQLLEKSKAAPKVEAILAVALQLNRTTRLLLDFADHWIREILESIAATSTP